MARARLLKPGFFTNADLCSLPPLHRLLFAGLWCLADKIGRLKDKPRELKVKVLPYDDCAVDLMLADLAALGFLVRYSVRGEAYILIPKFTEHQHPHHREPDSTIPDPPEAQPVEALGQPEAQPGLARGSTPDQPLTSLTVTGSGEGPSPAAGQKSPTPASDWLAWFSEQRAAVHLPSDAPMSPDFEYWHRDAIKAVLKAHGLKDWQPADRMLRDGYSAFLGDAKAKGAPWPWWKGQAMSWVARALPGAPQPSKRSLAPEATVWDTSAESTEVNL